MRFVIDASVATSWVLPYPMSPAALRLRDQFLEETHELIAPSCFIGEVGSALTKAERQKVCQGGEAHVLLRRVLRTSPLFFPYEPLIYRATDISSQLRSGLWDCLYLVLSEREKCELLTADERFVRSVQRQFPFVKSIATF
jgi:predicted nucleic acid-binding protein